LKKLQLHYDDETADATTIFIPVLSVISDAVTESMQP